MDRSAVPIEREQCRAEIGRSSRAPLNQPYNIHCHTTSTVRSLRAHAGRGLLPLHPSFSAPLAYKKTSNGERSCGLCKSVSELHLHVFGA
jgi:hypothetical protein